MRNRLAFFILVSLGGLQVMLPANHRKAQAQDEGSYGNEKRAIERVLRKQQEAWNRHDLEGFMAGYWNSPQLTFFSGAQERDGWQATLDRYLARYASPGHAMGSLEFSNLRVEVLGQQGAFARGSWKLTMPDGKTPHGLFTLVFRKFPDGWKIIHDHTSEAGPV
jgi:ketosteroid isomerase-like protein